MLVSLTIRCDWPGCKATLIVGYRAEITQQHKWKAENEGDYSQYLCPAHKRNDWEALRLATFKAQAQVTHSTPG